MRRLVIIVLVLLAVLVLGGIGAVVTLSAPSRPDAVATLSKGTTNEQGGDHDVTPLDQARKLLEANDPEGARSIIEPYLESNPTNADAIVVLGRCYLAQGDAPQASALIKQAVEAHPGNADYRYWYASSIGTEAMTASTLQQMSLGMNAMTQYKKAVELDPDHVGARQGLMFAAMMAPPFVAGGMDAAKVHADEIARIDEREGKIAYAQIAMREERHEDAITLLDDALAMSDDEPDPQLLVQFVRTLHEAGQTERAFDTARRLIAMGDRGAEGLYQIGRLSAITGEHAEEGLDALERYLERDSTQIPPAYAHWRRGLILVHLGRSDAARKAFEAALELMPGMDEATQALAELD